MRIVSKRSVFQKLIPDSVSLKITVYEEAISALTFLVNMSEVIFSHSRLSSPVSSVLIAILPFLPVSSLF